MIKKINSIMFLLHNTMSKETGLSSIVRKLVALVLVVLNFSNNVLADAWNTVWQEDFGVVEDSVCRDFADPNMSVPGHKLADVDLMQDGYYGILNSTYWAYIRKRSVNPNRAYNFVPGRDHTGNMNGGMLVINAGGAGKGESIYENNLDLNICGDHMYKLSMYVANVSDALLSPNLTLQVYNISDEYNPDLLETVNISGSDIVAWPGKDKNSLGKYIQKERDWTEVSLEFKAKAGDILKIEIKNNCSKGNGNDFAIDDITLQRYDEDEIVQPNIELDNDLTKETCIPTYAVNNVEVLNSWKKIYKNVYFLWQYSIDEGYTWTTNQDESGIEKTELHRKNLTDNKEVYRLIITGGNTVADAKIKAEEIVVNGALSDGCDYFSISNIISQVETHKTPSAYVCIDYDKDNIAQPAYNCDEETHYIYLSDTEWKDKLPSYSYLWQYSIDNESWLDLDIHDLDFPFSDVFDGLTYFRVILASDDEVLSQVAENGNPEDCDKDYLITNTVSIECKCTKPVFDADIVSQIICEDSPVSIEWKVKQTSVGKIKEKAWYSKSSGDSKWTTITGETKESLVVKNPKVSTSYLFIARTGKCVSDSIIFELTVNPSIELSPIDDVYICEGGDVSLSAKVLAGYPTSYLWNNVSSSSEEYLVSNVKSDATITLSATDGVCVSPEISVDVNVEKKVEISLQTLPTSVCEGESIDLVATANLSSVNSFKWEKDGVLINNTDMSTTDIVNEDASYKFTVLGDKCPAVDKEVGIVVEKKVDVTLQQLPDVVCEGTTVDLVADAKLSSANTIKWEKNGVLINNSDLSTTDIVTEDATFKFTVLGDKCPTVEKEISTSVEKKVEISLQTLPTSVCEGESIDLVATAKLSSVNTFRWEKDGVLINNSDLSTTDIVNEDATYKFTVLGDKCPVVDKEISIKAEPIAKVTLKELPQIICEGESVELVANAQLTSTNSFKWMNGNDLITNSDLTTTVKPNAKDLSGEVIYKFIISGDKCPSIEKDVGVKVEHKPKFELTINKTKVCENTEVVLNVEAEYPTTFAWLEKSEDNTEYVELKEVQMSSTNESITFNPVKSASFMISSKINNVCKTVYSNEVSLIVGHPISVVFDSVPSIVCEGNSVKLNATVETDNSVSYEWRTLDGKSFGKNQSNVEDTPLGLTTYEFFATNSVCPDYSKEFPVDVESQMKLDLTASDTIVCNGEVVELTTTYPYTKEILWEKKDMNSSQYRKLMDGGHDQIVFVSDKTSIIRVSATSEHGCKEISAEQKITVNEQPGLSVDDIDVCQGDVAHISVETEKPFEKLTWVFVDGDSINSNEIFIDFKTDSSITYNVTAYNGKCVEQKSAKINVSPMPHIKSHEEILEYTYQIIVDDTDEPLYYDFHNGEGKTTSNIIENTKMGRVYSVEVSNTLGCASTYNFQVPFVELEFHKYFYQGEENWKVENLNYYAKPTLRIYDRNGKLLFTETGTTDGWNGVYNGNPMPTTDYWYELDVPEIDKQYVGHFTLVRR